MAAVVRQPFAPIDGVRLQSLTSIKNTQNGKFILNKTFVSCFLRANGRIPTAQSHANSELAIPVSSPSKRKAADLLDVDDFENVDPALLFSKRPKASSDSLGKDFFKPPTFILTKSSSTPAISSKDGLSGVSYGSPLKTATSRPRSILNPKSPAKKLNSNLAKATTPMSAPAGRSPNRGAKRIGILNHRRTGTFARVDPPSFNLFSAPFSLDAAVKGTVPSYTPRSSSSRSTSRHGSDDLYSSHMKSSWFFDIHEDTPEQEMTNLLDHNTCRLDISSDEECEKKMRRDRVDARGKENIPPPDDISQTSVRRVTTIISEGGMEYEKPRAALSDLNVAEFYGQGVNPNEVIIVPADDDDGTVVDGEQPLDFKDEPSAQRGLGLVNELKTNIEPVTEESSETEAATAPVHAANLQSVEATGESFELWESSSAREEDNGSRSPSPMPASPASTNGDDFDDSEN